MWTTAAMTGYEAYRLYLSVKNHFTGKFNYFKYGPMVRPKEETYKARKDRIFFEKIAKRTDIEDILFFLGSRNKLKWIGDYNTRENQELYLEWKKTKAGIENQFRISVSKLYNKEPDFNKLFQSEDGEHPIIVKMYLGNRIPIEVLCILNDLVSFTKLLSKYKDPIIIDIVNTINKYGPYFKQNVGYDKVRIRKIILDIYS